MKRTISEVIELIKQKKESAERKLTQLTTNYPSEKIFLKEQYDKDIARQFSNTEAYTDILALLESSHLIEQEKAIDILKDKCKMEIRPTPAYYGTWFIDIGEKESFDCVSFTIEVNEEEKNLLNEVFKTNE